MQSSFVYGYGFENVDLVEDKALIRFIVNHEKAFCQSDREKLIYDEMTKHLEDDWTIEDYFENYACDNTGMEGNGAVISNIMSRETGIRFEYQSGDADCDSCPTVLFSESLPWQLNEVERELTEDALFALCKRYMEELEINDNPDGLGVEYYG